MPTTLENQAADGKERKIYPNLKLRIYTSGIRQNQLAKRLGIDQAHLSRIVNGSRTPKEQLRLEMAQVLECDVNWLFEQKTGWRYPRHSSIEKAS